VDERVAPIVPEDKQNADEEFRPSVRDMIKTWVRPGSEACQPWSTVTRRVDERRTDGSDPR
jgi:hypothetical protein